MMGRFTVELANDPPWVLRSREAKFASQSGGMSCICLFKHDVDNQTVRFRTDCGHGAGGPGETGTLTFLYLFVCWSDFLFALPDCMPLYLRFLIYIKHRVTHPINQSILMERGSMDTLSSPSSFLFWLPGTPGETARPESSSQTAS